jgi:hypothetical protein
MIRFALFFALALAVLPPARCSAQPITPGSFRVVDAKADKGKLAVTETEYVPIQKVEEVVVVANGKQVVEKRTVTALEAVSVTREIEFKGVKASDVSGKEIGSDKLAELLKEQKPVVVVTGPILAKHRALFKDTTVFLELAPEPKAPGK